MRRSCCAFFITLVLIEAVTATVDPVASSAGANSAANEQSTAEEAKISADANEEPSDEEANASAQEALTASAVVSKRDHLSTNAVYEN